MCATLRTLLFSDQTDQWERCKSRKYFSSKQKLYEYKFEVFVFESGAAIVSTKHFTGSVADIEIIKHNLDFHAQLLEKTDDELDIGDNGAMV